MKLLSEFSALARLATPLVSANLLQMAVYAIDVLFVARLGPTELAAATLGVFLFSLSQWTPMSLLAAAPPMIAAELGRRKHAVREVRRTFRMSLWMAAFVALPFLLLLNMGEGVLLLAGQDSHVAARAGAFLRILLFALIPGVFAGVMRGVAVALGRPNWTIVVAGSAVAVGAGSNWLLVFGHAGFPVLGLEGSAIATCVTMTAMMLAYAVILRFDRRLRRYHLFGRWFRPEWRRMAELARLGAPIALSVLCEVGLIGAGGLLIGMIGVDAVAAHAIAINVASIAFQIPFGIAQATTIRVGLAFGAGDQAWIGRAGAVGLTLGAGVMILMALAIWSAPRQVVGLYLDADAPANAPVVALAVRLLFVAAIYQIFDGGQTIGTGALRGIHDTRVPMGLAVFGFWIVGFGSAVWLGFGCGLGALGVWIGLAAGMATATALLVWRWLARERLGLTAARRY